MYRATFTCHDRNGDDGIYSPHDGNIGTTWHHSIHDAICACADDATAHADMYADTAETHWRTAFANAATAFGAMLHDGTTRRPVDTITITIHGDHDPADNAPWNLGAYTITADAPNCVECGGTLTGHALPNGITSEYIFCAACTAAGHADVHERDAANTIGVRYTPGHPTCETCNGTGTQDDANPLCMDCYGSGHTIPATA